MMRGDLGAQRDWLPSDPLTQRKPEYVLCRCTHHRFPVFWTAAAGYRSRKTALRSVPCCQTDNQCQIREVLEQLSRPVNTCCTDEEGDRWAAALNACQPFHRMVGPHSRWHGKGVIICKMPEVSGDLYLK